MLEAQVDAAPVNVGAFQFRHIEIPLAKVCQEWKPKGGGATNVYVAYEVRTYVTVRVEIPGDDIGFGKRRRLQAPFLTGLLLTGLRLLTRCLRFYCRVRRGAQGDDGLARPVRNFD